jgi:8-oxo-dGTP pyrophosphatase MutT (NUDIX family)
MEETGLDITVGTHLYTTDFFQISAFNNKDQIISIYYHVTPNVPLNLNTKTKPFDFSPEQVADTNKEAEVMRWIAWDNLSEDSMSLPIDKVVIGILKKEDRSNGRKFSSL